MSEILDPKKPAPKKAALGRGLGTLLGANVGTDTFNKPTNTFNAQAEPTPQIPSEKVELTGRILSLDVDQVYPNPKQPRKVFADAELVQLSQSIKTQGILQPIVVRQSGEKKFEIIAGERRWRAAQKAGLHKVPAIIKEVDDKNALELALIENIQRQNLNPIEEAMAYDFLMTEYKLTQQELGDRVGKERATVANSLRLLGLNIDVKNWVAEGLIGLAQAKLLLSVVDPKLQTKLAKKVKEEKLTVRALEKLVKAGTDDAELQVEDAKIAKKHQHIAPLVAELQKTLGTKTHIQYENGKGYLQLYFYSDEQLNEFVERMRNAWRNT